MQKKNLILNYSLVISKCTPRGHQCRIFPLLSPSSSHHHTPSQINESHITRHHTIRNHESLIIIRHRSSSATFTHHHITSKITQNIITNHHPSSATITHHGNRCIHSNISPHHLNSPPILPYYHITTTHHPS